jgi:cysteine desulfurase
MIYADNAATTRISDMAFEKMLPYLQEQYGNASSQYSLGAQAKRAVELARRQAAAAIGANTAEITFTSGGSEANSWVLRGVSDSFKGEAIHIVTSLIEHHSVLNACHALDRQGVEVTFLPANNNGVVELDAVKKAIRPKTKLISIMLANNEIGTIQPIAEIGTYLRNRGILFHTDAVQAVGHIAIDVGELNVDFLSASAHKFNGAKGSGFLYKRAALFLPKMIFGGEQEHNERAGTENVAGIVALGYALEESVANMTEERTKQAALVQDTVSGLKSAIPEIIINAEFAERLPGTINITFPYTYGESLMHLLDLKGISVSTSSACNSGKDEPSHVLLALGLSERQAESSIRISFGRYNKTEDVNQIVSAICVAYGKIISSQSASKGVF